MGHYWPDCGTLRFDTAAEITEAMRRYVDSNSNGKSIGYLKEAKEKLNELIELEIELKGEQEALKGDKRKTIVSALQQWHEIYKDKIEFIHKLRDEIEQYRDQIEAMYQTAYYLRNLLAASVSIETRLRFVLNGLDTRLKTRRKLNNPVKKKAP